MWHKRAFTLHHAMENGQFDLLAKQKLARLYLLRKKQLISQKNALSATEERFTSTDETVEFAKEVHMEKILILLKVRFA